MICLPAWTAEKPRGRMSSKTDALWFLAIIAGYVLFQGWLAYSGRRKG